MLTALQVDFNGIKLTSLLNLLTMTMIESCYLKFLGRPIIKSMLIISHFHSGMGSGYNNPT